VLAASQAPVGYIEEFEIVDDHRNGKIVVNLNGRLNKCGVISPRFDVSTDGIDQWTNYLLPSRQFGYAFVSFSIDSPRFAVVIG
jgi:small subunit ribosomal protein S15Ae